MNKRNLRAAVLAGLAGVAGIAGTAQAVNLNPDGLGQVLIYPYYTVNAGNFTLLSVVNTTGDAKAVKVRFMEGMNTREVLDFNLYMSAYDVWAAAIIPYMDGAALTTEDTSCTVPTIEGQADMTQEFLTLAYAGGVLREGDGGPTGFARSTEGHFEMIEMGTLVGASADDATHTNLRRPADCQQLVDNWSIIDGTPGAWLDDAGTDMEAPSGGLFGGAAVVNGENGTMYSYDARAIEGFSGQIMHFEPGNELPGLDSGDQFTAYLFFDGDGDGIPTPFADSYLRGVDAVSAVFMHDAVMNEYNTEADFNASSEWVVTFPTKRFYTDPVFSGDTDPVPPFTTVWSDNDDDDINDGACEIVRFGPGEKGIWDREEQTIGDAPRPSDEPVFSPSEGTPDDPIPTSRLCWEVNVIRFGALPDGADPDTYAGPTEIFGSSRVLNVNNEALGFESGWLSVDLLDADDPNTPADEGERLLAGFESELGGLPVTGFWALEIENNFLGDGADVIANYGGLWNHKGTRCFSGFGCGGVQPQ